MEVGFLFLAVVLSLLIFSALDLLLLQRCACSFHFKLLSDSLRNNLTLHLYLPKDFIILAHTLQINRTLDTYQPLGLLHRQFRRQFRLIGGPPKPFVLDLIRIILREASPHDYYLNESEYIDWRHQYERRCNHSGIISLRKAPLDTTSVCYWLNCETISSFDCRLLMRDAR